MKICVIFSSYEGSGSAFEEFDEYQDPSLYVVSSHTFIIKFVTKENAKEEIDEILKEKYDYIWNFMWGSLDDNVAGIDAIKYLESKHIPIIGASSKFTSMTKLDFKQVAIMVGIKIPNGTTANQMDLNDLKFPLILKPSIGCGSLYMTKHSICHNISQLLEQIEILKSKVTCEIIIEEYIEGQEFSIMVLETVDGVIALEPIIYEFPMEWKPTEKFLNFHNKFTEMENKKVTFKIFDEDLILLKNIKEAAVKIYEGLGVLGCGYARIDFRVNQSSDVYMLEVNQTPAFFSKIGNQFGDDFVIESTFPGAHEALVDVIIKSRERFDTILSLYNGMSDKYEELTSKFALVYTTIWKELIEGHRFDGTILDLGCGTGKLGRLILQKHNDAILSGIDVSPEMIRLAKEYSTTHVGLIENIIGLLDCTYDHVVSSGAFLYIDNNYFFKIFTRMFELANDSISMTIEDVPQEYILQSLKDYNITVFNHVDTILNFKIPMGWSLVYKETGFLWESPLTGIKVYGLGLRYEKKIIT